MGKNPNSIPFLNRGKYFFQKVDAPLIPKIKSRGDTSQFQEYEENEKLFHIASQIVHSKDFEDF